MPTLRSRAVVAVRAVEFSCPVCGEAVPSPTGSLFWTYSELPEPLAMGCPALCGMGLTLRAPWHRKGAL